MGTYQAQAQMQGGCGNNHGQVKRAPKKMRATESKPTPLVTKK